ncbi:MAG: 23S rRNA (adenine(2503)-C(2))-methyltransferase RlmN [Candidatus Omnitrophota bacterium]|nr:MAG: 23S rRNA (adenine(2503)-C(2))-methyltransferase RlmN [Candidatus Omnitrophota bacterium]
MEDIKNYTIQKLQSVLEENEFAPFCAQQIFGWVYKRRIENFDSMTDISQKARSVLKGAFYFSNLKLAKREVSCDGTEKFLFGLNDRNCIETVLIPQQARTTLCLSTQVGCKFGCVFCLSGKAGFRRNLTASEIINQYLHVQGLIGACKITNIVFMGIGEPLDNFFHTVNAVKIFTEPKGIHFGRRRICISTCGLTPQIEKLEKLNLGVKLSISLHSPDNRIRSELVPINKKYPLQELIRAVKHFHKTQRYPVTFEYALIGGLNTKKEDALALAKLLKGLKYKINLIPLNRMNSRFQVPSGVEIRDFQRELEKRGVFSTLRKSRGQDINAACGQLRAYAGCKRG